MPGIPEGVRGRRVMFSCLALALALLLSLPPEQYDTVVLTNGGILRGSVVKDLPGESLVLELTNGELWTIPRSEIAWIQPAMTAPPGEPTEEPAAGPAPEAAPSLEVVPVLQGGVSIGLALPAGRLDASGLAFGSAVSPQLTFTFEGSYRPVAELELGLYMLLGGGTSHAPLNDYCLAVGGWCDAFDLSLGFFPRWSILPRGSLNPWVMISGGFEWLSVMNSYHDSFDYSGWLVGAAVGIDLRHGPGLSASFQLGTRWGQFTSLSVSGLLPIIEFAPATHGWIDVSLRGNYGM